MVIKTIIIEDTKNPDSKIRKLTASVPTKKFDLKAAIKKTVQDYIETDEGRVFFEKNGHRFTFDDLIQRIPTYMLNKRGFDIVNLEGIIIDANEDLAEGR